jgi:hypothetical protein
VTLDLLKTHAGFLALPWATLVQHRHRNIAVLQVATYAGEYGVSSLAQGSYDSAPKRSPLAVSGAAP